MKVAITGSASFIGGALCRLCNERGIEWHGIDIAMNGLDICDPRLAEWLPEGIDALIHLAAISRDGDCRADPAGAVRVNIGGTQNVIDAARRRGVGQILFASTEWVYGEGGARLDETAPIDLGGNLGVYALTKASAERLLAIAAGYGDIATTVLRFGIVYGPRPANWSAVEGLLHAVATRDRVEVGSLRTARRFIHVEDIAAGILAAAGRTGFEIFNLTGSELVSLGDIVAEAARLTDRKPEVRERAPELASIRDISNQRAIDLLGWRPRVSLRLGLQSLLRNSCTTEAALSGLTG
jgi:UDP-glucose 4-epimerase